ncbi:MAG: DegT/DnrJ/EryC1/StrS family aminotransferase [Candidatus Binatia bacterium]
MPALMRVPAANLRAQHDALRAELRAAFDRVLDASAFIHGPEVEAFEREFAAVCEVQHAVGVSNGTEALALALRALTVGEGDSVALPAFTFAATAEAVCHVGARPVLIDIDPTTFTLDTDALRYALQARPVRAIIPVHLYGQPAAMDDITALAQESGAAVVEDAAQAHGARYRGRRVGGLGRLGCFSFYPSKNLGALGDAGAVTTHDAELAARLRLLRDHGQMKKYSHSIVGFNARLDGLQAALLRVKLPHLDRWNARRQALAAAYRRGLADLPGLSLPGTASDREHVYHLFVVRCRERGALQEHLDRCGIATGVHYPLPIHLQPAFASLGYRAGDFPASEAAAREVLALPMYPELTEEAVMWVCDMVRTWTQERRL